MRGLNKQQFIIHKLLRDIANLDVKELREDNFDRALSSIVGNVLVYNEDVCESFFIFADKDTIFTDEASLVIIDIPLVLFMWNLYLGKGHIVMIKGHLG